MIKSLLYTAALAALSTADADSRSLQDNNNYDANAADYNAYFPYDLTQYSMRFEKCQVIKMFSDNEAKGEGNHDEYGNNIGPFALKDLVVFFLCPSDSCQTSCDTNYGRYVVDVEDFLKYTIEDQMREFEYMCENCAEVCNGDGTGCSGCGKLCYQYNNLENMGYVDASAYSECQQFQGANQGDDGNQQQYYIGPRCASNGHNIVIGLFTDQYCTEPVYNVDIEELLGAKLSYHLLSQSVSAYDGKPLCLTCQETEENNNANDAQDADNVNEMCENLYNAAAKCESKTGIPYGFIQTMQQENNNKNNNNNNKKQVNQVENEYAACTFIESLLYDSYTETGEINVKAPQDAIVRYVTHRQRSSLGGIMLVFTGLLGCMYYLQRKIEKMGTQVDMLPAVGSLT